MNRNFEYLADEEKDITGKINEASQLAADNYFCTTKVSIIDEKGNDIIPY